MTQTTCTDGNCTTVSDSGSWTDPGAPGTTTPVDPYMVWTWYGWYYGFGGHPQLGIFSFELAHWLATEIFEIDLGDTLATGGIEREDQRTPFTGGREPSYRTWYTGTMALPPWTSFSSGFVPPCSGSGGNPGFGPSPGPTSPGGLGWWYFGTGPQYCGCLDSSPPEDNPPNNTALVGVAGNSFNIPALIAGPLALVLDQAVGVLHGEQFEEDTTGTEGIEDAFVTLPNRIEQNPDIASARADAIEKLPNKGNHERIFYLANVAIPVSAAEDPIGNHWFPIAKANKHTDKMTKEAYQVVAGAYAGDPDHLNTTYGGITHPKYSDAVEEEFLKMWKAGGKKKITPEKMQKFLDNVARGRTWDGKERHPIIAPFNKAIRQRAADNGTAKPLPGKQTIDDLRSNAKKFRSSPRFIGKFMASALAGVLTDRLGATTQAGVAALANPHFAKAVQYLAEGNIVAAQAEIYGPLHAFELGLIQEVADEIGVEALALAEQLDNIFGELRRAADEAAQRLQDDDVPPSGFKF